MIRNCGSGSKYIISLYAQEDEVLLRCKASAPSHLAHMQLSPEEGRFLYMLLRIHNARKVLEIGTFVGYSAIWIARAITGGKIVTIEKTVVHAAIARKNLATAELDCKVEVLQGDALEILPDISEKFDAVFIDAQKSLYPVYLKLVLPLLRAGGLLIADNTLLEGRVYSEENSAAVAGMRHFNEILSDNKLFCTTILAMSDGMTVAIFLGEP